MSRDMWTFLLGAVWGGGVVYIVTSFVADERARRRR
jgi:hypothetical protein